MANELTVPNLADTIRDRIRQTLVSAIPDDQIDKLVKSEWDAFFVHRYLNHEPTKFEAMVRAEIDREIRKRVVEAVNNELNQFQATLWEQHGKAALREMVKAYAPKALEGIAETMAAETLSRLSQNRTY